MHNITKVLQKRQGNNTIIPLVIIVTPPYDSRLLTPPLDMTVLKNHKLFILYAFICMKLHVVIEPLNLIMRRSG